MEGSINSTSINNTRPDPRDHLALVYKIAYEFCRSGRNLHPNKAVVDTEEFADGCCGMVEAARRFDPARGFQFSTFASHYIRGYIMSGRNRRRNKGARRNSNKRGGVENPRFGLADRPFTDLGDDFNQGEIPSVYDTADVFENREHQRKMMQVALSVLDERDRLLVCRRALLGWTLAKLGRSRGVTKERARQLLVAAYRRMQIRLIECGLSPDA